MYARHPTNGLRTVADLILRGKPLKAASTIDPFNPCPDANSIYVDAGGLPSPMRPAYSRRSLSVNHTKPESIISVHRSNSTTDARRKPPRPFSLQVSSSSLRPCLSRPQSAGSATVTSSVMFLDSATKVMGSYPWIPEEPYEPTTSEQPESLDWRQFHIELLE